MSLRTVLIAAAMLPMLVSCAPIADANVVRPVMALINAPADDRVGTLADRLEAEVASRGDCCSFGFMRSAPIRFQETHRNLFGSRAVPAAADLARNLASDFAVLISAPVFEREVVDVGGNREVRGAVQLLAIVVDAETEEILARVPGATHRAERLVPAGEAIPAELEQDPTMQALIERAVGALSPTLATVLEEVAAEWRAADAAAP